MPTLIINEPGRAEPLAHRCSEEQITIGRLDDNTIQLLSEGVSRRHAKIICEGENFFLVDMESGNGTYLNGIQIKPNEKNLLQAGDLINIDDCSLSFQTDTEAFGGRNAEDVTDSDILEVKLLKKVLTALDKETVPSIEVLNGSAEGKKFFFTDDVTEIVIGRDPECDFPINEYVVSRKHTRITRRWGGIAIRDLESKNGTFLNNRRIVEEFLHDGDRIALGTIVLIFRNPQEINLASIEDIKPKNPPARVSPQEIPGLEQTREFEAPKEDRGVEESEARDEKSAIEEWERLEEDAMMQHAYPTPTPHVEKIKTLTPMEIGMLGLGALVLIFAVITIVNLIAS